MRKGEIILICLLLLLVYFIFSRRVEGFGGDGFFERLFTWMSGSPDDSECGNWSDLKIDNKTSNMYIHPKIQYKPHIIKIWNNLNEGCKITKQSLTKIGISREVVDIMFMVNGGNPFTQKDCIRFINLIVPLKNQSERQKKKRNDALDKIVKENFLRGRDLIEPNIIKKSPEICSSLLYIWIGGGQKITKDNFNLISALLLQLPEMSSMIISDELDDLFNLFDTNKDGTITISEFRLAKIRKNDIKEILHRIIDKIPVIIVEQMIDEGHEYKPKELKNAINDLLNEIYKIDTDNNGIYIEETFQVVFKRLIDSAKDFESELTTIRDKINTHCSEEVTECNCPNELDDHLMGSRNNENPKLSEIINCLISAEREEPDTSVPDTSVPDTSVPDTSVPDTSVPDTGVPDTGVPDTGVPDTSVPVEETSAR